MEEYQFKKKRLNFSTIKIKHNYLNSTIFCEKGEFKFDHIQQNALLAHILMVCGKIF